MVRLGSHSAAKITSINFNTLLYVEYIVRQNKIQHLNRICKQ